MARTTDTTDLYRRALAKDLDAVANLIGAAEMESPAETFAHQEIEALRYGAAGAMVVISELLERGRSYLGCETLADVAEFIAGVAAETYKKAVIDEESA